MRNRCAQLSASAIALLVIGISACSLAPARADDAKLDGNWKLVVLAFGDDDFAVVKLSTENGKTAATVVDAQERILGRPTIKQVENKGNALKITLNGTAGDTSFEGKVAPDGVSAGKIFGICNFRDTVYPARLEKTSEAKVGAMKRSPLIAKLMPAANDPDPKSKVKKLVELITENHGAPNSQLMYGEVLRAAEKAGLDEQKVGDLIKQWSDEATPYGDTWVKQVQMKALNAIGGSKSFAKLIVALAQEVDRGLSDEAIAMKYDVAEILARAARVAGIADVAKDAESRRAKLEVKLDEEYNRKVPPFKPATFAGRKDPQGNRVVLMEVFTGAECPPCVAADVAFDALLQTYKPTEFIGLQYHLHIPGPDPLTNTDSEARQNYYGSQIRGTPSTFFNGRVAAGGGGGMGDSQAKYTEFRGVIDKSLEATTGAQIELTATRTGDQVKIAASARVPGAGANPKSNGADATKGKQFLRLALIESDVHYPGGNKLRFHHNVVRALPGGAAGRELTAGDAKVDVTVKLAELKHSLETYLSDFAKSTDFPNPLPAIKLEDLAVVAFIQDDGDKSIDHAVLVPVKPANP
jgi:hypothetical protein